MSDVAVQNRPTGGPSAGVVAAASLGIMGSIVALIAWGWLFLALLSFPADGHGRHAYENFPITFFGIVIVPPVLIAMALRIGVGLFQMKQWARRGALLWAALALAFSSAVIAFRPYEIFVIPERFVSPEASFRQLLAISFVIFTFPFGAWWLIYFTRPRVIAQFKPATPLNSADTR